MQGFGKRLLMTVLWVVVWEVVAFTAAATDVAAGRVPRRMW